MSDEDAFRALGEASDVSAVHTILHYLYVPEKDEASRIATELKGRGFRVEVRLGADGVNWLVLARHEAVPTEDALIATRQAMEALVESANGEYDGWEAEVRPLDGDVVGRQ